MKEKDMIKKWKDINIEDGGGVTSDEYKEFQRNYKSVLKDIGKQIGFDLHSFNGNHYEFSAVMKSNATNKYYYISISDIRYFKNEWAENILYRTMEHERDWTGGSNNFSSLEDLSRNLLGLDKQKSNTLDNESMNYDEIRKSDDFDYDY